MLATGKEVKYIPFSISENECSAKVLLVEKNKDDLDIGWVLKWRLLTNIELKLYLAVLLLDSALHVQFNQLKAAVQKLNLEVLTLISDS